MVRFDAPLIVYFPDLNGDNIADRNEVARFAYAVRREFRNVDHAVIGRA